MIHEDDRRILESFPEAKIIKAKQDCIIGQHYHKIKTEKFFLVEGEGILKETTNESPIKSWLNIEQMPIGKHYHIFPNIYHEFHLKKGAVLIGINSHPYDPTDDYKL